MQVVAGRLPVPVIAYDLPVSVHTKLARDTIISLAREGAIVGLKDSSGDAGGLVREGRRGRCPRPAGA